MSRHTEYSADGRYEVCFGKDHACEWFIQVFDIFSDSDDPIVDKDTLFDNIGYADILDIAGEYGVVEEVEYYLCYLL